jgi:hypothetical protein
LNNFSCIPNDDIRHILRSRKPTDENQQQKMKVTRISSGKETTNKKNDKVCLSLRNQKKISIPIFRKFH